MKTMKCKQLGGACDREFSASSFEEIAEMSKNHGIEMFQIGDEKHLEAMSEMKKRMSEPGSMKRWMEGKRKEFEALPDDR